MLNLYYKPACPYCVRVLHANEQIKAPLSLIDTREGENQAILIQKGGKQQVPFLEDTDRGVMMYESLDIIEYLRQHYGSGQHVHVIEVGNVCPID